MLINEWQLGSELNEALQQRCRADFQLWLSVLSPATEEQAGFCLPDGNATPQQTDLRQQLQLPAMRDPAMLDSDIIHMRQQGQALQQGGFAALQLSMLLQPQPQVIRHDAKKLSAEILDNLSLHSQRHLQHRDAPIQKLDATLLYDVLEQLHTDPIAA
ncbi:VC2046/SO_2500 family protein [Rheinheimera sp.]|uniref:VC2046/SO_2500 family protein n=1 Tax=Rheinheimera sp. TaxID=1869214 RepID=UPI003D2D731D